MVVLLFGAGRDCPVPPSAAPVERMAKVAPVAFPTIVDLKEVTLLASMGIRMIVGAARSLRNRGVVIALFDATPAVREILETANLDAIVPICSTEHEAAAAAI